MSTRAGLACIRKRLRSGAAFAGAASLHNGRMKFQLNIECP